MRRTDSLVIVLVGMLNTCAPTPVLVNHEQAVQPSVVIVEQSSEVKVRHNRARRAGNKILIEQARRALEDARKRLREMK